jgi:uncharacterized protein
MSRMPYFILHALDRPDAGLRRAELREAHRAYIRRSQAGCRCVLGGPLENESGEMIGSLLVLEAEDRSSVELFLSGDPYAHADLYAERRLHPWRWGLGRVPGDDHLPPDVESLR